MASTYTESLRLTLMTPFDPTVENQWGSILNENFQLLEASITGNTAVDVAGLTTYTLTVVDGETDQARLQTYNFSGALTAACTITLPQVPKTGFAINNTTGGYNIVLTTGVSEATNLTIPPAQGATFNCDGSNVTAPTLSNPVASARLPGEMVFYAGPTAPSLWYFCNGETLTRSSYPALLAAITFGTTGNITNGGTTISGVPALPPDISGLTTAAAQTDNLGNTAFSVTEGSPIVTITDGSYYPILGQTITIVNMISIGGLILQGPYTVIEIDSDAGTYQFNAGWNASSTTTTAAVLSFSTTESSATVGVSLSGATFTNGQEITVGVSTSVGGLTLIGGYTLSVSDDVATLTADGEATSTTTGSENGGNIRVEYAAVLFSIPIEGANIPTGTTLLSFSGSSGNYTLTISAEATADTLAEPIRLFPWGDGDGSTTFNLPDMRGRAPMGADALGGTAAGRLNAQSLGNLAAVGTTGGNQLAQADNPAATTVVDSSATSSATSDVTDPTHGHWPGAPSSQTVSVPASGEGGASGADLNEVTLSNAATGITVATTVTTTIANITTTTVKSALSGNSQNIPPMAVGNWIIYGAA